jgi:hypothetical protein
MKMIDGFLETVYSGLILTRHESGEVAMSRRKIKILPVWWWALQR